MSHKTKNFYEILDLKRDCTLAEIKESFVKLSKEFHPDKNNSKDAHDKFIKINEAYSTLSNPSKRKLYDSHLSMGTSFEFRRPKNEGQYSGTYDYTTHHYTKGSGRSSSHTGNGLLFRLALLPKAVIVTALVMLTIFSSGIELFFLKKGFESKARALENSSFRASLMLERAVHQAKISGRDEQLRKLKEGKLGVYDADDDLVEAYIRARESRRFKSK